MSAWDNYDDWKLSTPPEWDDDWVLDGEIDDYEIEVEHEDRILLAQCYVNIESDQVKEVEIKSLMSTDDDGNDHEFKEEDFKYYQSKFDNQEVHQKILDENFDNEELLTKR